MTGAASLAAGEGHQSVDFRTPTPPNLRIPTAPELDTL
jgi:hypothetical protein